MGASHTIVQKDKNFSAKTIDITLGDKLIFNNQETDITHNVYSLTPGNEFELKTQVPGSSTSVEISKSKHKKGKMLIECAIHPWMKLWVNVK